MLHAMIIALLTMMLLVSVGAVDAYPIGTVVASTVTFFLAWWLQ